MRGTGAIVYNDCDCVVYDDYANCETVIYTWTACDSTVAVNILSMLHPSYLLLLVHCGVRSRFFLISVSFLPVPTADTVHVLCLTSAFSSLLQNIFYHVFYSNASARSRTTLLCIIWLLSAFGTVTIQEKSEWAPMGVYSVTAHGLPFTGVLSECAFSSAAARLPTDTDQWSICRLLTNIPRQRQSCTLSLAVAPNSICPHTMSYERVDPLHFTATFGTETGMLLKLVSYYTGTIIFN